MRGGGSLTINYSLKCELECLEDVHVGSGLIDPEARCALLSRSGDSCVIPGSSLKGMIRTVVEYKHRDEHQEDYCFILVSGKRPNPRRMGRLQRRLGLHQSRKRGCKKACRICGIFGKPSMASRIMFSDAVPPEGFAPAIKPGRFGWKGEVFPKGTILSFKVTGNLEPPQFELLLEGLRGLNGDWKHYLGLKKYDHMPNGGNVLIRIAKQTEREMVFGFPERGAQGRSGGG